MKASVFLEVLDETIVVTYDDFISVEFDRYEIEDLVPKKLFEEFKDHIDEVDHGDFPGYTHIFNCDKVDSVIIYDAILELTQFGINPIKLL